MNDSATDLRKHRTVIRPRTGWIPVRWHELWHYRGLLWAFTSRDIKVRYKQTLLGFSWAALQPIMSMVVFTVIFGKLAGFDSLTGDVPYQLVVMAGILPWSFFQGALGRAGNSLVANQSIVTKVYFPRLWIPLSSLGSGMVDFLIALFVLFLLMMYYGFYPSVSSLLIPVVMLGIACLSVGIGMIFSAIIVKVRDFGMVLSYITTFWMYLTPVMYPAEVVSEKWRWLLDFNPMYGYINCFRSILLEQPMNWISLFYSVGFSILFLVVGLFYFTRVEKNFADVV
ncbi:ABC transporter permease [Mariprofundus ferrooxydans]|uniref:ABC transporter permease n=1 Tax=Mariprofundus ferrooxydans TaxID=314344 RepID=UPI000680C3E3|nr:ABC transporter permease [Mariprofundus ferrooxydans]